MIWGIDMELGGVRHALEFEPVGEGERDAGGAADTEWFVEIYAYQPGGRVVVAHAMWSAGRLGACPCLCCPEGSTPLLAQLDERLAALPPEARP